MITQKMLMQGACRDVSAMAALLASVDGARGLKQTIESAPDGCEPEDLLTDDAIALHSLIVELPDESLAHRVCECASIAADLLDAAIQFQGPVTADAVKAPRAFGNTSLQAG